MALAGLGQCALIVRARLGLVPAPAEVTLVDYDYADLDAFLDDQRAVARDPAHSITSAAASTRARTGRRCSA